MAGIDANTYGGMVATRLDHLQMLQSTVSGFLVTLGLGTNAVVEEVAGIAHQCTVLSVILVILVLGYFFSVYQSFAVIKCVKAMSIMEKRVEGYCRTRYIEAKFTRLSLYLVTHDIQFFVAFRSTK